MIEVKEIYGNIFNTQCQVIVNAVNCKGVMGRGIAHEFKLRYPEMFEEYKRYCDEGYMEPGILQLYTKSNPRLKIESRTEKPAVFMNKRAIARSPHSLD